MEGPSAEPIVVYPRRPRRHTEADDVGPAPGLAVTSILRTENTAETKGDHKTEAELVPVEKKSHLGLFATTALILNKTIGTGIYVSPRIVLAATGSKGMSLMIWIVGCIVTWAGMFIYLEYGMRWPVSGGELYYIHNVFTKPPLLFTYIFASMFVLVNGVQANALQFGKMAVLGDSPRNIPINENMEKFFAILILTFVCQLLAYSRFIYVKLSNILALIKVFALIFIVICGWVALSGDRKQGPQSVETPYGKENLISDFASRSSNPYQYSLALLNVMRAFLGYENANFVLAEVRAGPNGDETRIFRRAVKISVVTACFLYIMVNVAFFAVCTTEEMINEPETLPIFLQKVFGLSDRAYLASTIEVCFSAGGTIIALTFANARVKQEIARMGLVPIPEFWSDTSHRRTPAHALLLHWIFSVVCIVITPLNDPAGFLIMSTFYSYLHTWIGVFLGCGLLCAPWHSAFKFPNRDDPGWKPQSSSLKWWLLGPLVLIYIASNAFVLILSWFPANLQVTLNTTSPTLPYYTGPVAGLGIIGFGILWWAWDRYILPGVGYIFWIEEKRYYSERWNVEVLRVTFYRELKGPAKRVYDFWRGTLRQFGILSRRICDFLRIDHNQSNL